MDCMRGYHGWRRSSHTSTWRPQSPSLLWRPRTLQPSQVSSPPGSPLSVATSCLVTQLLCRLETQVKRNLTTPRCSTQLSTLWSKMNFSALVTFVVVLFSVIIMEISYVTECLLMWALYVLSQQVFSLTVDVWIVCIITVMYSHNTMFDRCTPTVILCSPVNDNTIAHHGSEKTVQDSVEDVVNWAI